MFDPGKFQLGSTYRSIHGELNKLPKNSWILAAVLIVLVLLEHWFLWPVIIGALLAGLAWLGCLA
jgi:hypothetical protein